MKHIKSVSRKEKIPRSRHIIYFSFKLIVGIVLFFLLAKYKALILVLIFEVLDFFKTVLKPIFPYTPIDFEFIFGATVSYFYSPWYGVIIFFLSVINRIILPCIELRHVSKCLRHVPLYFLIVFLKFIGFFPATMIILVLNYILKYLFKMLKADFNLNQAPFNIVNFSISVLCFYLIDAIYYYLPFLA